MLHDFEFHSTVHVAPHNCAGSDGGQGSRLGEQAPRVVVGRLHQHRHTVTILIALIGGLVDFIPVAALEIHGITGVVGILHPAPLEAVEVEFRLLVIPYNAVSTVLLGVAESHGIVINAENHRQLTTVAAVLESYGLLQIVILIGGAFTVRQCEIVVDITVSVILVTVEIVVFIVTVLNTQFRLVDHVVSILLHAIHRRVVLDVNLQRNLLIG